MIPVAIPYIAANSRKYVDAALRQGAISGLFGNDIAEFENGFADFVGTRYAVACSSGTAAIHLALAAYGIGPGDEVLVPSITNMATFFAVLYCGATPVPVDIDIDTFNISVSDARAKTSARTKAILVVHLFGQPADMDAVMALASEHDLAVFEDCAESHGSTIGGNQTGSFGIAGCFSLFANKNINTGEGGIVTTNNLDLADKMRSLRSLSFGKKEKFLHEGIGFNYRMDNLKAALGRAQMEEADSIISAKVQMGQAYDRLLAGHKDLHLPIERQGYKNTYWMYHVRLSDRLIPKRDEIMQALHDAGIETRPGFVSFTFQPFCDSELTKHAPCPVAEKVSFATFYLPSTHGISEIIQTQVADTLTNLLDKY